MYIKSNVSVEHWLVRIVIFILLVYKKVHAVMKFKIDILLQYVAAFVVVT